MLDLQDDGTVEFLWYLQHTSYKIEATLIGFTEIPPLTDTFDSIRNSGETFLGHVREGEIVSALSYARDKDAVMINRLMVHPNYFRQGLASELLQGLFRMEEAREYRVFAGSRNLPAIRLYEKHGFQAVREEEASPGVPLTELRRMAVK
ncbi:GNAT family N-acetyltransferase [Xylanibacillus composti]|uniref:GNAT family N-acetyltransferase n=1 Tax=Xylanibacillus composti TaxID=1572762 RepID=UPI001FD1222F|nr:GNAT family N-acetyltransferase [Xylanibacillus composti]